MRIDFISVLIGGLLWEIISAYIHFVAAPRLRRWQAKRNGFNSEAKRQQINEGYSGNSIGFNCQLKN